MNQPMNHRDHANSASPSFASGDDASRSRRDFLATAAVTGLSAGAVTGLAAAMQNAAEQPASTPKKEPPMTTKAENPLKILVLGGTTFLGPAFVRSALARGHSITLFNRGKSRTSLFPEVEKLVGDRNNDLEALKGREWDVVVDTSASLPKWVEDTTSLLKDATRQYMFISSVSCYAGFSKVGISEDDPVGTVEGDITQITGGNYGPAKARCEAINLATFGDRATNIRPGLIVGPEDPTDRFTYWPVRVGDGGEVLAPGDGQAHTQVIDVRDLGEWMLHCCEKNITGTFNAVGPEKPTTMKRMLETCQSALKSDAKLTWVDAEFLQGQGVGAWMNMPCWVPPVGDYAGFGRIDGSKAFAAGLSTRPLDAIVRDTQAWFKTLPEERQARIYQADAGRLTREREAEVLAAWKSRPEVEPDAEAASEPVKSGGE